MLGMTPSCLRKGGAKEEIRFAVGETALGSILVASSAKGVAAILLGDDPAALARDLQDRFPQAILIGADADYEVVVAGVVDLLEAPQVGLDLPLDVRGTAFQQRVWQALRDIPLGKPGPTSTSRSASDSRARPGLSPSRVRPTNWLSRYPAIGSCASTAPYLATLGESSASAPYSPGSRATRPTGARRSDSLG